MNPKMRMDDAAKAKMRQHVLAKTWEGIQLVFPIPTSDQGPAALRWKSWACVRNACKTYPIKTQWQKAAPSPMGARDWFRDQWGVANKNATWAINPWVWAIEFQRI